MAIVSLIALFVALALIALVSVQPWQPSVVAPQLGVAPGLEVDLGDAVAVQPGGGLAVAPALPAGPAGPRLAAATSTADKATSGPRLGLAPARAVSRAADGGPAHGDAATPPPPPTQPPQPLPPAAPEPVATPVAAVTPEAEAAPVVAPIRKPASFGAAPGGPSTAGGGVEEEEEEPPAGEEEEPEPEEGEGGDEEGEGEGDECTPPFVLRDEAGSHELVICEETSGEDEVFYLLLDGERLGNLELPYPE
ncbi:MAG TPA: hypothetical protein VFT19_13845 [Solirubrobacterales bacterium]|nr:hypothetical protein [Solirubrobacterales bacterium]